MPTLTRAEYEALQRAAALEPDEEAIEEADFSPVEPSAPPPPTETTPTDDPESWDPTAVVWDGYTRSYRSNAVGAPRRRRTA